MAESTIDHTFIAFQEAIAGRYSLERELGRGGMGVVYLAREVRLDRRVAIKLLPPELAVQSALRDRFMREARTAARLSHPYIVPLHAVDEVSGFVFYVMAYIDGETLAQRVSSRGPLSPRDATRILREVSWALAYAHAQGVVHRDVKPANILLERGTERAMVTDFGIARAIHSPGETGVGELLGTPEYMSPEQAAGEELDGRSDLYSLGIVGYYALTGQLPFNANNAHALLAQHLTKPAPSVSSVARGVPRALAMSIDRCLEKDASKRFPTGEALADALAPNLEKAADVPVPVRIFLDHRRMAPVILPLSIGVPMSVVIATGMVRNEWTLLGVIGLTSLALAATLGPLAIITVRLRRLAKLGYGPDDLAAGLQFGFSRKREEFLFEYGESPSRRERALRMIGIGGLVVAAIGLAGLVATRDGVFGLVTIFGAYGAVIGQAVGTKLRRLRKAKGSFWARFWDGKIGQTLGRIARHKLGASAVAAERPTELAIAMSASSLYEALPKATRDSLGDVPGVLQGLESRARTMRANVEKLDVATAAAQQSRGGGVAAEQQASLVADLRAAREQAEERLTEVVTALETLRLDLLRLSAGAGGVANTASITRAIESARAVSEDADRLLAGRKEVEDALSRR